MNLLFLNFFFFPWFTKSLFMAGKDAEISILFPKKKSGMKFPLVLSPFSFSLWPVDLMKLFENTDLWVYNTDFLSKENQINGGVARSKRMGWHWFFFLSQTLLLVYFGHKKQFQKRRACKKPHPQSPWSGTPK